MARGEFALSPSSGCRLLGNFSPTLFAQLRRPRHTALSPKLLSGLIFAVVNVYLDLTRRDLHDLDGSADHIGRTLLAFRSFRHMPHRFSNSGAGASICLK